jgi:NAD(P)-dependent dehydrogenase (short-subunit alcohol dehydrogenase family)
MQIDYHGKTVFVAGGTSGINLGIALAFARAGARLAVLSRTQAKVDAAVESLTNEAGKALGFAADVRDAEAVRAVFAATHAQVGAIDVLVSGAAGNFPALAKDLSPNGFKAVVDIDLLGSFNVLKSSFDFLAKPGACLINISAPQASSPMPAQIHVCAAKAGVDMLTRVLAMEWGRYGVRVNSLVPGPIDETEGMRRLAPTDAARRAVVASVPLERLGTVDDVANAALLLASPLAAYITGTVLAVDGGWSLGGDSLSGAAIMAELARAERAR